MRVVVVGQIPPPVHGSNVVCQELVASLRRTGHEVELVDKGFSKNLEQVGHGSVHKVAKVPSLLKRALGATKSGESLVVYFTGVTPGSFMVDALCLSLLRRQQDVSVILYVHAVGFRRLAERGPVWRRVVKNMLGNASLVVALSPTLTRDISPWASGERVTIIRNPVPGADPGAQPWPEETRQFLFLSNLTRDKGADTFLRAAEMVAVKTSDIRFVVAGAVMDVDAAAELREFAARPTLRGRVTFTGFVDAQEKVELLRESLALVFPSRYSLEASPLTVLEAKRAGRPSLASDIGGIGDMVHDGVDGRTLPPMEVEDWAQAMLDLVQNPEAAVSWGRRAREDYEARFAPEQYDEAWSRLLIGVSQTTP